MGEDGVSVGVDAVRSGPATPDGSSEPQAASAAVRANAAIGGYCPAEKWLKDRKGHALRYDDIEHYRRICGMLSETPHVMAQIDQAINSNGGWPLE